MAALLIVPTFSDPRGSLSVLEGFLPFTIDRVYYIYDVTAIRGGHRHKKTRQALICLSGSCNIYVNNGHSEHIFKLDSPDKCLLVEPEDWHTMSDFSATATLLVFASERYNQDDYIDEKYP